MENSPNSDHERSADPHEGSAGIAVLIKLGMGNDGTFPEISTATFPEISGNEFFFTFPKISGNFWKFPEIYVVLRSFN
jgi:hypothetical protein